jgi:hypothetical protein
MQVNNINADSGTEQGEPRFFAMMMVAIKSIQIE